MSKKYLGRENDFYKQFEELQMTLDNINEKLNDITTENRQLKNDLKQISKELEKEKNENKKISEKNEELEKQKSKLDKDNKKLEKKVGKLNKEVDHYKILLGKNSSNSSKPSGTNGFKNVITNRRVKSTNKVGGQYGHKSHKLDDIKIKEMIDKGAILKIVDVNKNSKNNKKDYRVLREIDIKVKTIIKEYRYYPDEKGNYTIPNNIIQPNYFGDNVKSLMCSLNNQFTNSMDASTEILKVLTGDMLNVSKGTICNWIKELNKKLKPVIEDIEEKLLESYYLNCDESNIKVNGKTSNALVACNDKYVRFWYTKNKKTEDIKNIGFLPLFNGIIVKDGTDIYNPFGNGKFGSCDSHICRYNKGISDFINHKGPMLMTEFLINTEKERQELIFLGFTEFSKTRLVELNLSFSTILKNWIKEWQKSGLDSPLYDEERKLLSRYEEEVDEILLFMNDFKIPFTNNNAESQLRPIKIRQKIGKPRTENGAEMYCNIRSCINTYKKQGINVLEAFKCAFNSNPLIP